MAEKLTDVLVKRLEPPVTGNHRVYDTECVGFGARVTAKNAKSFILRYRVEGYERIYTIGKYPDWSVAAARTEAKRLKREEVDKGLDPLKRREEGRDAPTIRELIADYEHDHLPSKRPRSAKKDRDYIERFIKPSLGRLKVASVTQRDIRALHHSLRDTPYQANRVLALISKMFSLAVDEYRYCNRNPVRGVTRYTEDSRMRFLSADEMNRLSVVLDKHESQQAANVVRLCLLTGARSGEVMSAKWNQFDLDNGIWTKPSAHTKQKKTHTVPLNRQTIDVLRGIEQNSSGFVFPGRNGSLHLTTIKKSWDKIRAAAGLRGVRLHDLRHTYASHVLAKIRNVRVVGDLLGHTQPQTTAKYTHALPEHLREATEHMGELVASRVKS